MLGEVGPLEAGLLGQLAHRVLALGQQLQHPHAGGMRQRLEEIGLGIGDGPACGEAHVATVRLFDGSIK